MKTIHSTLLIAALALAAGPAAATSVTGGKISRIRFESGGLVAVTSTIVPPAGCRTASQEHYVFDGRTDLGRARFTAALVAYATQSRVDISGAGTCTTISTGLLSENLTSITIY